MIAAVERVKDAGAALELNSFVTVVDAMKCKIYMKNFGEFFNNQVEHASAILLSRTQNVDESTLHTAVHLLREHNPKAAILTTPWDQLTGAQILQAMEGGHDLAHELMDEIAHHHHHELDEHCDCGCHEHEHHHHEHDEHCDCGCHDHEHEHHHHEHDEHCDCGCHDHEHEHDHHHEEETCSACHVHQHHHADEVFTSWGRETPNTYTREDLQDILSELAMGTSVGTVLRAKGMVPCSDCGHWLHFDLVPGEFEIREGGAEYTGRLCVIGSGLDEDKLAKLFAL